MCSLAPCALMRSLVYKIPFVHTEAGHGSRYMAIVSCLLCLLNFPNQDEWGKLPVLTSRIIYN